MLALADGADRLAIGDAPDWAVAADGGSGPDALLGGPSDDELAGGRGADLLRGGAGQDGLDGGGGRDSLAPGVSGVAEDRVACGAGRDEVTLTPRLDAPLLRPSCERITAGVLRVVRWSFPAAVRLRVRAAPGEGPCRVRLRGPENTVRPRLGTQPVDVRLAARVARVELRVEPSAACGDTAAFALRLARSG